MSTSESAYFSSSGRSSSRTCRQLTQQKVQKSSTTMRPRRSASERSCPPVLSQPRPVSSGARRRERERWEVTRVPTRPGSLLFPSGATDGLGWLSQGLSTVEGSRRRGGEEAEHGAQDLSRRRPVLDRPEQGDLEAAKRFYGGLFGWTFVDAAPPGAPVRYVVAQLDGQDVGGPGRRTGGGAGGRNRSAGTPMWRSATPTPRPHGSRRRAAGCCSPLPPPAGPGDGRCAPTRPGWSSASGRRGAGWVRRP